MALAFRQIKVYFKLVALVVIAGACLIVVVMNRGNTATVWLFGPYPDINVLWLMLCTAIATLIAWWLVRATAGVMKDMRELHRDKQQRELQKHVNERLAQEKTAAASRQADSSDAKPAPDSPEETK